jgi:hypothetical protein
MATVFSGTAGEKTDQLVTAMVALQTGWRFLLATVWVGLPMIGGLMVFLITQTFQHSARLERMEERLGRIEKTLERLDRIEDRLGRIEKTLERLDERLGRLEKPPKP